MKGLAGVVAVALSGMAMNVMAQELDVSLNNDAAAIRYTMPFKQTAYGHTDVDFGLLYTESNDVLGSAGIGVVGDAGAQSPGLKAGIGVRAYAVSLDNNDDMTALTLGGLIHYNPPTAPRFGVGADIHYAPDVTTFGDAKRFWELGARFEYEILPQASLYLGVRKVRADMDSGAKIDMDEGAHIGMRMSF